LPSHNVTLCSSFASVGRTSRKRHTPLRSMVEEESRRCFHVDFSCFTSDFFVKSFLSGYVISSNSPHWGQRKLGRAVSLRSPQPMQRKRKSTRLSAGSEVAEGSIAESYFPRRYRSVLLIQSARGGLKTSRSTVSSSASALCGMCAGMHRTSPACTTISRPSIQNFRAPSRM